MSVTFHYLWDKQLLIPTYQQGLSMQAEDTKRALSCPVYTEAIRRSVYLVTAAPFTLTWHGGNAFEATIPEEWQETYDRAAQKYVASGGDRKYRYTVGSPLAADDGGTQRHQGGLMVNFFTGMSIEMPICSSMLVTRPWNNFQSAWTIQDGIYSSAFKGEFSLNLQIMQTGVPIHFRAGESVATLFFFLDGPPRGDVPDIHLSHVGETETVLREELARRFYEKKASGRGYRAQCPFTG